MPNRAHGLRRWVPVALVLLVAVVIRAPGIVADLPYIHHTDEHRNLKLVHRMVVGHDPNPHFFNYPSLFLELQAVVHAGYVVVGEATGRFERAGDVAMPDMQTRGNGVTKDSRVFLLGRLLTVVQGVALVGAGMWLAWVSTRRRDVMLGVGTLLAVHPTLAHFGRLVTPDTLAGLTVAAALALAVVTARSSRLDPYPIAGAAVGVAAASKYNAVVVAVGLIAAHFYRHGRSSLRMAWLLGIGGLAAIAAFAVLVPFAVLDWRDFLHDATSEARHYRTGHPGSEGDSLVTNARWLWASTGPALALAAVGAWQSRRTRLLLIPLVFTAAYFALLSTQRVRFERNLVPLLPALLVLVAAGGVAVASRLRLRPPAVALGLLVVAAWPAVLAVRDMSSTLSDERAPARQWVTRTLPPGSTVMVENHSPYVDPGRFKVLAVDFSLLHGDAIRAEQPSAVVVTRAGSGRWLRGGQGRDDAVATASWLRRSACERMPARNGIEVYRLECP